MIYDISELHKIIVEGEDFDTQNLPLRTKIHTQVMSPSDPIYTLTTRSPSGIGYHVLTPSPPFDNCHNNAPY